MQSVAFETRRLHDAMTRNGETFVPLPVSSLVDSGRVGVTDDSLSHASGQVFDVDYSGLPPAELECLRFVLDDLGWGGYLGFIDEGHDNVHIGCAPSMRDFFTKVFGEALESKSDE